MAPVSHRLPMYGERCGAREVCTAATPAESMRISSVWEHPDTIEVRRGQRGFEWVAVTCRHCGAVVGVHS